MIARIRDAISAHFAALRRAGKWKFFWWVSVEGLVVPIVLLAAVAAFVDIPVRTDLEDMTPGRLFVMVVIIAPFVETLISQAFPVMIARAWRFGFWAQVIASVLVFAPLHAPSGIATVLCAGVISGFYIGFTYVHWRQQSFRSALWMTSGTHAFHNLILIAMYLLDKLSEGDAPLM
jgi:hypothetical protein